MLKVSNLPETKVTVRKINDNPESYISLFKDLKERGEYRIIIDCHVSRVGIILEKVSLEHTVKCGSEEVLFDN